MLDENDVVEAICKYLADRGYKILEKCTTSQRGIDIRAEHRHNKSKMLVEAKGGTSSREGTNRFGLPYTSSQVFDRVAKALYTGLRMQTEHEGDTIALAFPDTLLFRDYLIPIRPLVQRLGLTLFLVQENKTVITF